MNDIQRAWRYLIGNIATIVIVEIVLFIAIISSCIMSVFLFLFNSVASWESSYTKIVATSYQSIPLDLITEISSILHVNGYNESNNILAKPINAINVVPFESTEDETDLINLSINQNVMMNDVFRLRHATIIKQSEYAESGAIVEKVFCINNNLNVGSKISFVTNYGVVDTTVSAIYEQHRPIELSNITNTGDIVYYNSPSSYIFLYNNNLSLSEIQLDSNNVYFYIDNIKNIEKVLQNIEEINYSKDTILVYDATDFVALAMQKTNNNNIFLVKSLLFFQLGVLITTVIFSFMYLFKIFAYEGTVLLAIGKPRQCIVNQFTFQIFFITIGALVLSLIATSILLPEIKNYWVNSIMYINQGVINFDFSRHLTGLANSLNYLILISYFLNISMFTLAIAGLACIIASVKIKSNIYLAKLSGY